MGTMAHKPVVLIIRDGWGVNPGGRKTAEQDGNAVGMAEAPYHTTTKGAYAKVSS